MSYNGAGICLGQQHEEGNDEGIKQPYSHITHEAAVYFPVMMILICKRKMSSMNNITINCLDLRSVLMIPVNTMF